MNLPRLYNVGYGQDPRAFAQKQLSGRCPYVDPDTLRCHRARIISAVVPTACKGLLFALVESVQVNAPNCGMTNVREFRYVIFDLFGNIVGTRAKLGEGWRTSAQAAKAMWKELDTLNAQDINLAALEKERTYALRAFDDLQTQIDKATHDAN